MKANELMIGDLLQYRGQFAAFGFRVEQITRRKVGYHVGPGENRMNYLRLGEVQPIPLTPEILVKNGFEEWDGWRIFDIEDTGVEIGWCGTILKIGGECGNLELPSVVYVHELQHALRLCGIEKEIIL